MENGHRNSGISPWKMVMFHCYVSSPEGILGFPTLKYVSWISKNIFLLFDKKYRLSILAVVDTTIPLNRPPSVLIYTIWSKNWRVLMCWCLETPKPLKLKAASLCLPVVLEAYWKEARKSWKKHVHFSHEPSWVRKVRKFHPISPKGIQKLQHLWIHSLW